MYLMGYIPLVEVVPQKVLEYCDPNGRSPFREWLRSLKDLRAKAQIRKRINRLRLGNFGDAKSVGGGVMELRLHFGPGYRVYFSR